MKKHTQPVLPSGVWQKCGTANISQYLHWICQVPNRFSTQSTCRLEHRVFWHLAASARTERSCDFTSWLKNQVTSFRSYIKYTQTTSNCSASMWTCFRGNIPNITAHVCAWQISTSRLWGVGRGGAFGRKQKQRAMWQSVHKLLLSLPLVGGNLACYVRRLPGCAHTYTHTQARLPPANQGASSVGWAPLFCSSSRNKSVQGAYIAAKDET